MGRRSTGARPRPPRAAPTTSTRPSSSSWLPVRRAGTAVPVEDDGAADTTAPAASRRPPRPTSCCRTGQPAPRPPRRRRTSFSSFGPPTVPPGPAVDAGPGPSRPPAPGGATDRAEVEHGRARPARSTSPSPRAWRPTPSSRRPSPARADRRRGVSPDRARPGRRDGGHAGSSGGRRLGGGRRRGPSDAVGPVVRLRHHSTHLPPGQRLGRGGQRAGCFIFERRGFSSRCCVRRRRDGASGTASPTGPPTLDVVLEPGPGEAVTSEGGS